MSAVGELLREWRSVRRLSQYHLALEAGVSARHVSWVENGKSQPSRDMIDKLADTLDVPLRERNVLMLAAGYAPAYPESSIETPALEPVRRAVDLIVEQQEPYPAFVLNRRWDILRTNRAAVRVAGFLRGGIKHANMIRQFFDPEDMRAVVVNWEDVAGDLARHLHDEITAFPSDPRPKQLLDEVLRYPGVPERWRTREFAAAAPPPLLTVVFRKDKRELRFFSTITRFATPGDVTLDDLRIECAFPADEATAQFCQKLAKDDTGA